MKKILISCLFVLSTSSVVFAMPFNDVPADHTYVDGIQFLFDRKIVVGNPDGSFEPDDILNRAEGLTMIVRAVFEYYDFNTDSLEQYKNNGCFSDVGPGLWYTKYICFSFSNGWVIGYSDGNYSPGKYVNFVEGLKIIYKGFDFKYIEGAPIWYKYVVEDASLYNYIPITISDFGQYLTRAEMADIIARVIKFYEGDLDDYLGPRKDAVVSFDTISDNIDMFGLLSSGNDYVCEDKGNNYAVGDSMEKDQCTSCSCNTGGRWFCMSFC